MKKIIFSLAFLYMVYSAALGAEFSDGRIRLVLHENTGHFSLYYLTYVDGKPYEPLFTDRDPRSSFLSLMVNNQSYRLGESSFFKTTLGGTLSAPVFMYESSLLTVTNSFSFIKTGSSLLSNGVMLTITITNRTDRDVAAGIRLLIDTNSDENDVLHFMTDQREINAEETIEQDSIDRYWTSKTGYLVLKVSLDGHTRPDLVHFANWKRLNDASWKIPYIQGRNFSLPPYSVNDSAVCHYYDPVLIPPLGGSRIITVVLSGEIEQDPDSVEISSDSTSGITGLHGAAGGYGPAGRSGSIQSDLVILHNLQIQLDEFASSNIAVSEEELAAMKLLISRIKLKYDIP
ncbi:MAG: hypothetical protein LBH07_09105 [Treponema sp.]|jgi:hypothetical protein|nr:hypothetical protein [Treponema sp.]